MSRHELIDEPELVREIAKLTAPMDKQTTAKVVSLCSACFDAGVAWGLISRVTPSPALQAALEKAKSHLPGGIDVAGIQEQTGTRKADGQQ